MLNLSVNSKFKMNVKGKTIEGYVSEYQASIVVNGAYVDVEGFDCIKRTTYIASSYSESEVLERDQYDAAPVLEDGSELLIDGVHHRLEYKGVGFDFANMIPVS